MTVIATDLPLSDRQLKRVDQESRSGAQLTGSFMGHGSGDIMIGFTTANRIPESTDQEVLTIRVLKESFLDTAFTAAAEAVEEAVLNSLPWRRLRSVIRGDKILPDGSVAGRSRYEGAAGGSLFDGGMTFGANQNQRGNLVFDMDVDAA